MRFDTSPTCRMHQRFRTEPWQAQQRTKVTMPKRGEQPDDPSLAGNRRIAIVLLREAPVLPTDTSL